MAEFDYSSAAAAMQAASQALATAAPAIGNRRQMKRAFKYQQQAMEQQNKIWRENTEWLTELSSPANQVARYQEAGINPNFVFGQINAGAQSGATPSAKAPDVSAQQAQFAKAISGIADIVPMFQAAVKAQQDLKRGELATQMDLERLRSMQINNQYQADFLDTRNKSAAYDYAWKTGTDSTRRTIMDYQAADAERSYFDAVDQSNERKERFAEWKSGKGMREKLALARLGSISANTKLTNYQYDLLQKYGVKSLGDMSFGGLLLSILDQSGTLPGLVEWLSGEIGDSAEAVEDITAPVGSGRKTRNPVKKLIHDQGVAGYNYTNPVNNGGYTAGFNIYGY